jgi:hypothetical protein
MKPDQAAMHSTCPARINRLSPAETLRRSKHYRPVMVQYCGGGNIASAAWAPRREYCGTPSRQLRKYDSERRDFVPGFLRNRALRGSQVKNDLRNFTLELRGP